VTIQERERENFVKNQNKKNLSGELSTTDGARVTASMPAASAGKSRNYHPCLLVGTRDVLVALGLEPGDAVALAVPGDQFQRSHRIGCCRRKRLAYAAVVVARLPDLEDPGSHLSGQPRHH
jgi:hypothetical protein